MMNILIETALARRWFVLALALVLAGLGVRAFQQIPIDAFPDVSTTQVKLILKAPGMTPEEVESRIAQPVETELLGIPKQTILRSQSKNALVDITVDFAEGTDIYWARQQVAERFANVKGDLPANVSGGLAPISTPLSELYMFTLEGPLSLSEKRTLLAALNGLLDDERVFKSPAFAALELSDEREQTAVDHLRENAARAKGGDRGATPS